VNSEGNHSRSVRVASLTIVTYSKVKSRDLEDLSNLKYTSDNEFIIYLMHVLDPKLFHDPQINEQTAMEEPVWVL